MPAFNFTFKIDVYHHLDEADRMLLGSILSRVISIQQEQLKMSQATDNLVAKTERIERVAASIATVVSEIKTALDNAVNANDMAVVQACAERLGNLADNLVSMGTAADITPDTPVDPDAPPAPAPAPDPANPPE